MQVTLELPDHFGLEANSDEWGVRIKLYAALAMYQAGQLSAGAACEFAGIDRFTFIQECARMDIPSISYGEGELESELVLLDKTA